MPAQPVPAVLSRGPRPLAGTAVLYDAVAGYQAPLWLDRLAGVAWRFVAVMVALIALVGIVVGFGSVILPLFLGLLFASALDPINRALRRRGLRPALAALAAITVLAALAGLVAWTTIRAVADQWDSITVDLDIGVDRLVESADDAGVDAATAQDVADDVTVGVTTIVDWIVVGVTHVLPVVASIATTIVLGLLVAFFFLKDGA